MFRVSRFGIGAMVFGLLILAGVQIVGIAPAQAATIDKLRVTCNSVSINGKTEVRAPFVRIQVALGSNLTTILAKEILAVAFHIDADYQALLYLDPPQPDGTLLVMAVGEWDGLHYLRPATITSRNCNEKGTPPPTPTFIDSPIFTPTPLVGGTPPFVPSLTFTWTPMPIRPTPTALRPPARPTRPPSLPPTPTFVQTPFPTTTPTFVPTSILQPY